MCFELENSTDKYPEVNEKVARKRKMGEEFNGEKRLWIEKQGPGF